MALIAVIDLETTGLNPYLNDRIIELGAVVIDQDGAILREFTTLVNPERDIGPTRIHGLRTSDVADAPRFRQVASARSCSQVNGQLPSSRQTGTYQKHVRLTATSSRQGESHSKPLTVESAGV
jgi:hypothetical protein